MSLLEAHMNQPTRVALLQRRDGYDSERLEVGARAAGRLRAAAAAS